MAALVRRPARDDDDDNPKTNRCRQSKLDAAVSFSVPLSYSQKERNDVQFKPPTQEEDEGWSKTGG